MADLTTFITALEAAQNGAKYAPEVQKAAAGINTDELKKAYAYAEAQGDGAKVEDAAQSAALKAGFEFAAKLVMELQSKPERTQMAGLYVHYKIGNDIELEQPGAFQFEKKYLYNAWVEAKKTFTAQGSQAKYIKLVVEFIAAHGLRD